MGLSSLPGYFIPPTQVKEEREFIYNYVLVLLFWGV